MGRKEDLEFIRQQWRDTVNSLRDDFNKWENHTLKEYVIKCAELAERMIEFELLSIEKSEISSYLTKEFIKEGIEVSDRYVRQVLPSDFKRNYSESELTSELNDPDWTTKADLPGLFVQQNQFGKYRINGVEQNPIKEIHKERESLSVNPENKKTDEITKTMFAAAKCGNLIERIYDALQDKYNESDEFEKIIAENLKDKQEFFVTYYAKLQNARNEIDDRNKWGDHEKLLSKFLIETGETTANLAELLNYCAKFGSIGIDRHGEFVDEQTKQFKKELLEFLMKCPKCHENIFHMINEDIERYRKGQELKIAVPVLGSYN